MKRLFALAFALLLPLCGWAQGNSYINFASGMAPSYAGLWWNAAGKGMWLVMSNTARTGDNTYAGAVYRASGPAFDSASWDVSKVRLAEVGSATFTFTDGSTGTFAYTVDGVTQSKAIQRMVYALPTSVCN